MKETLDKCKEILGGETIIALLSRTADPAQYQGILCAQMALMNSSSKGIRSRIDFSVDARTRSPTQDVSRGSSYL